MLYHRPHICEVSHLQNNKWNHLFSNLVFFFLFTIKSEWILTSQYHNLITTNSYIALNTNLFYLFRMSLHISSYCCNHCNVKTKGSPFTSNGTCELAELWQLSYFFYAQCVKEILIFILISTYTNLLRTLTLVWE